LMYELGRAVEPNYDEALRLYQEASKNEMPLADFQFRWLTSSDYLEGRAKTDASDMFRLYSCGSTQGYLAAQFGIGWMYERGHGVVKDTKQAILWYKRAGAQGHSGSEERVRYLQRLLE
ncbi:hypothetical protein BGZ73_003507, partial [Actinomortierella ambigua]